MQKTDLKLALEQRYKKLTPILVDEIDYKEFETTKAGIQKALERLVSTGELRRFRKGVYYLPKYSQMLKKELSLPSESVFIKCYLEKDGKINGYKTGLSFLNDIGLTTQVPQNYIFVLNGVTRKKKIELSAAWKPTVLPPKATVTSENYRYLQVFDFLENYYDYAEVDEKTVISNLSIYLESARKMLSRSELINIMRDYSKNLILRFLDPKFESLLPEV
ncbi:MAG: DUF6088 family protein [Lactobacillales bacterium]|jgi:hypothetical protein|nr:DUF6088 family protein [Lactobacillales bacterium]